MRALLIVASLLPSLASYAQETLTVDLLEVQIGNPNPIKPLRPAKQREGELPFYSITVPMPETSQAKVFFEYHINVMFDSEKVSALRANRTLSSIGACESGLKSLITPLTNAYRLKPIKSERSVFEATAGDVEVQIGCGYVDGSAFPTLTLYVSSKTDRLRVSEHLRKLRDR
jgi:hypothetical protein